MYIFKQNSNVELYAKFQKKLSGKIYIEFSIEFQVKLNINNVEFQVKFTMSNSKIWIFCFEIDYLATQFKILN